MPSAIVDDVLRVRTRVHIQSSGSQVLFEHGCGLRRRNAASSRVWVEDALEEYGSVLLDRQRLPDWVEVQRQFVRIIVTDAELNLAARRRDVNHADIRSAND